LRIDKSSHRVFVNHQEIFLAQKEFDLLLYLASNPNRVFNREELFEKVWGLDSLGDASTVTVHIARIREKIEKAPQTHSISKPYGAPDTGSESKTQQEPSEYYLIFLPFSRIGMFRLISCIISCKFPLVSYIKTIAFSSFAFYNLDIESKS
jgi:hypothetical protein